MKHTNVTNTSYIMKQWVDNYLLGEGACVFCISTTCKLSPAYPITCTFYAHQQWGYTGVGVQQQSLVSVYNQQNSTQHKIQLSFQALGPSS